MVFGMMYSMVMVLFGSRSKMLKLMVNLLSLQESILLNFLILALKAVIVSSRCLWRFVCFRLLKCAIKIVREVQEVLESLDSKYTIKRIICYHMKHKILSDFSSSSQNMHS